MSTIQINRKVSAKRSPHSVTGRGMDYWHLARSSESSVILQRIPPGISGPRHFHEKAWQFYFFLEGEAVLKMNDRIHRLKAREGIEVSPGVPHAWHNASDRDCVVLVISTPPDHLDTVVWET